VWRRVRVLGTWDPSREVVIRGRAFLGSPGVQVATVFQPLDGPAVLVLRGWMPAADGLSADLTAAAAAQDGKVVQVEGLALPYERPGPIPVRRVSFPDGERPVVGTLDHETVSSELGEPPLRNWYLLLLPDDSAGDVDRRSGRHRNPHSANASAIRRLAAPALTDGPHALYAFQWFGFAAIALAAGALLPRAARAGRRPPEPPPPAPGPGELRSGKGIDAREEER
jgi:cytochrome oxidase assembly protein ShyY1